MMGISIYFRNRSDLAFTSYLNKYAGIKIQVKVF